MSVHIPVLSRFLELAKACTENKLSSVTVAWFWFLVVKIDKTNTET